MELSEVDSNNWRKLEVHLLKPQPTEGVGAARKMHDDELWRPMKQTQRRFTSDEELAVVEDYRAGGTIYTLAEKYGCHRNTISRVLESHAVGLANPPIESTKIDEMVRLYELGLSMNATARKVGVSARTVFNHLHHRGAQTRDTRGQVARADACN